MSTKVEYTDRKTGNRTSVTFGVHEVAKKFALTVKDPSITTDTTEAPLVTPRIVNQADVGARRLADRNADVAERQAEAYMEAGSQSRLMGASTSDALDDARDAAYHAGRTSVVNTCSLRSLRSPS